MIPILKTKPLKTFYNSLLEGKSFIHHCKNSRQGELKLVCPVGTPDDEN